MSTAEEIRREMDTLEAERERLQVVDEVLLDMHGAASAVRAAKDYTGDGVERAKESYGFTQACSAMGEYLDAGARWRELHDRWFDEVFAQRDQPGPDVAAESDHASGSAFELGARGRGRSR